jgi:hypothetical protein
MDFRGATHHMATKNIVLYYISTCMGPPILMGDDTQVEVIGQGRVEIPHGNFENILHVPKLFVNPLSVYQITHSHIRKRLEFTHNSIDIFDVRDKSTIFLGEVSHQYRLYTFSKFIVKSNSALLLTNDDDTSILWHEIFNHLNFKYMQQQ